MTPESWESANIFNEVIRLQEVTAERQGMAQNLATDAKRVQRKGEMLPYGMLSRLATWGVLATISLGLAAISAYSSAPRPTAADTGSAQSRTSAAEPGEVDGNTRRLIEAIHADLGGVDRLATGERQIVQRAALLGTMAEDAEARWLAGQPIDPNVLCVLANAQRRLFETLGLSRRSKDVTPSVAQYIANIEKADAE